MRYCSKCGWLTPLKSVCIWCGNKLDDSQPDDDAELDSMDFPCGCGG